MMVASFVKRTKGNERVMKSADHSRAVNIPELNGNKMKKRKGDHNDRRKYQIEKNGK